MSTIEPDPLTEARAAFAKLNHVEAVPGNANRMRCIVCKHTASLGDRISHALDCAWLRLATALAEYDHSSEVSA